MGTNRDIINVFASNLRRLRLARGFTYAALSTRCGIDRSELCKMESGKINIGLCSLAAIAKGLEVTVEALLMSSENISL
ncbi:helix-turn-helix domain-containing protein [Chitinophaga rhizosphaerae]|uniref:helix-turn-helix domain-containing protein n=1 Tax=Chitinophaga rhizosphaerae TaxID=1864947 RepID=UPI000F81042A